MKMADNDAKITKIVAIAYRVDCEKNLALCPVAFVMNFVA